MCKKMRSPIIIGTILTPLKWSYSFHKNKKLFETSWTFLYIYIKSPRNSVRESKLSLWYLANAFFLAHPLFMLMACDWNILFQNLSELQAPFLAPLEISPPHIYVEMSNICVGKFLVFIKTVGTRLIGDLENFQNSPKCLN